MLRGIPPVQPLRADVHECANLLRSNGQIVVLAGADVVSEGEQCVTALRNFVDTIQCAVMCGMNARGVYPESQPRWGGVFVSRSPLLIPFQHSLHFLAL